MRYFVPLVLGACLLVAPPGPVGAQCEGGTTSAGYYRADGSYVPGGCLTTNPFTPGQIHPSGAQPASTRATATSADTSVGTGPATVPTVNSSPIPPRQFGGARPPARPSAGDPTGAYGTSLPAAPPPPETGDGNVPPAP
jgi:hypothetical protein